MLQITWRIRLQTYIILKQYPHPLMYQLPMERSFGSRKRENKLDIQQCWVKCSLCSVFSFPAFICWPTHKLTQLSCHFLSLWCRVSGFSHQEEDWWRFLFKWSLLCVQGNPSTQSFSSQSKPSSRTNFVAPTISTPLWEGLDLIASKPVQKCDPMWCLSLV